MKVDTGLYGQLSRAPELARQVEAEGCWSGFVTGEVNHDPFFPLLLAAEHTERVELCTSIAVAFARNPMTLANLAHDLNAYSRGRLILGLGSQIEAHITKRFSMPFSKPAARMREFVQALHAIWDCWYDGKALDFRGEFYRHTLMTPTFNPVGDGVYASGSGEEGSWRTRPRVFVSAVGPKMTEVAGEVADGLVLHAFTTPDYLCNVTLPALERGLAKSGRPRSDFEVSYPPFVVCGRSEREIAEASVATRMQIAFYGSTPAYRPVLEEHGWGALQAELNRLSKLGRWQQMGECIDDDVLQAFAVLSAPETLGRAVRDRFDGLVDRVTCNFSGLERSALLEQVTVIRGD